MEAVAFVHHYYPRVDISVCDFLLRDLELGPFSMSSASLNNKFGPGSVDPMGLWQGQTEGLRLPLANTNQGCDQHGRFPQVN